MKIYIPFQKKDIGGPSSFVKKFASGMQKKGHEVTFKDCEDYDLVFVIVQAPFSTLWKAKQKGKPIVQRLDGVYYWSVAGWKFPLLNAKAALIRHFFADYSVYQSEYSRYCVNRFLGKKLRDHFSIIYNGVDTKLFSPTGNTEDLKENPKQLIFFSASEFRRTDQILPLLEALSQLKNNTPLDFKLVLAGHFIRELEGFEQKLAEYPWVQFLGKIPNERLPEYERGSDLFLFTHLNPPCPNNVIEAMSSGLPIVGVADGAMGELIEPGKEGQLLPTRGNAFWKRRSLDSTEFASLIIEVCKQRELYSKQARETSEKRFSLEKMVDDYEKIFISLIQ